MFHTLKRKLRSCCRQQDAVLPDYDRWSVFPDQLIAGGRKVYPPEQISLSLLDLRPEQLQLEAIKKTAPDDHRQASALVQKRRGRSEPHLMRRVFLLLGVQSRQTSLPDHLCEVSTQTSESSPVCLPENRMNDRGRGRESSTTAKGACT